MKYKRLSSIASFADETELLESVNMDGITVNSVRFTFGVARGAFKRLTYDIRGNQVSDKSGTFVGYFPADVEPNPDFKCVRIVPLRAKAFVCDDIVSFYDQNVLTVKAATATSPIIVIERSSDTVFCANGTSDLLPVTNVSRYGIEASGMVSSIELMIEELPIYLNHSEIADLLTDLSYKGFVKEEKQVTTSFTFDDLMKHIDKK